MLAIIGIGIICCAMYAVPIVRMLIELKTM